ncbi:O-antigen acetylase [Pseudomonas chlororaphis]|nr:O-antigen acetylase [Pseudomonas chlororaphis]
MNDKRIMDIELLRGIAVLGVVFHHLQGNLFREGPPGWAFRSPVPSTGVTSC